MDSKEAFEAHLDKDFPAWRAHVFKTFEFNHLKTWDAGRAPLLARIADYEEVLVSHRKLVRQLDVIVSGENGAALQASLCDLINPIKKLAERVAELEAHPGEPVGEIIIDESVLRPIFEDGTLVRPNDTPTKPRLYMPYRGSALAIGTKLYTHPAPVPPACQHILYETGDFDAPEQITDRNGEVVLAMCRKCGNYESGLGATYWDKLGAAIDAHPKLIDQDITNDPACVSTDKVLVPVIRGFLIETMAATPIWFSGEYEYVPLDKNIPLFISDASKCVIYPTKESAQAQLDIWFYVHKGDPASYFKKLNPSSKFRLLGYECYLITEHEFF